MSSHVQHWKHSSSWEATVSCTAWRGQYLQLISPNFEKLQLLYRLISFGIDCKHYHWTSFGRLFNPPFFEVLKLKTLLEWYLDASRIWCLSNDILVCTFLTGVGKSIKAVIFRPIMVMFDGISEPWHEINTIREKPDSIFCMYIINKQSNDFSSAIWNK